MQDILENDDVKLDNMFIASLVGDILRVSTITLQNIIVQLNPFKYEITFEQNIFVMVVQYGLYNNSVVFDN